MRGRPARSRQHRGGPNRPVYGAAEDRCRHVFERLTGHQFPPLKRIPELDGMDLDGYSRALGLAFEYQGRQHYEIVPVFHRRGLVDFVAQVERDARKRALCRQLGVDLIEVPFSATPDMPTYVERSLRRWVARRG